jgi:hypothetical protein
MLTEIQKNYKERLFARRRLEEKKLLTCKTAEEKRVIEWNLKQIQKELEYLNH